MGVTYKQYKINNSWGINCITGSNGSMSLEIIMLVVPWEEVVESEYGIQNKDEANEKFKELVLKYKKIGEVGWL